MSKYRRYSRKPSVKRLFIIVLLVVLAFGSYSLYKNSNGSADNVSESEKAVTNNSEGTESAANQNSSSTLTADLNKVIRQFPGVQTAVSVIDLDNGTKYDAGDTKKAFVAASITKILAAVGVLREVDNGQLSLSKTIDGSSAGYLLQTMIRDSNNQSWYSLRDYIGDMQLQTLAISSGLRGFTGGVTNTLTASDEARLLSELALGRLISAKSRDLLYSYMQNTSNDQLIPAALPAGAVVYHKYGLLDGNLHDSAIVSYKGRNFVIVILSNSSSGLNYEARTQMIHKITEKVLSNLTR